MFYPKIDTLYTRGADHKVTDQLRRPEFGYVNNWLWMEKLDGSNISIVSANFGFDDTMWRGRTNRSQFTKEVQDYLNILCERWHDKLIEKRNEYKLDSIEIFGEVIGPKIQGGEIYSDKITSRFYDVRVNQSIWLDWNQVINYSRDLEFTKPAYGTATTLWLVDTVRDGFKTFEGTREGSAEGIVAKTLVPLYNNNNDRLIWKLKTKDFA